MYTRIRSARGHSFILIISLVMAVGLALSACGTNITTNTASPSLPGPAPTSTLSSTVTTTAIATACKVKTPITQSPAATIVLTGSNANTTINVKNGDTIEVDLPAGQSWQGPTINPSNLLTEQTPSDYLSNKNCVWHFTTGGTGTVHLSFTGRPICQMGQACPMYVMAISYTLDIK